MTAHSEGTVNHAIGQILPLALGIAMSPSAIVAAVLMLLSPTARRTGVAFLFGWLLAILIVATVFTLLAGLIPTDSSSGSQPVIGVLKIVLGALLLLVAVRQWVRRPKPGSTPVMPKWMSAIDSMTPVKGFGLGLVLATANPKDLLMGIGAGVAVGAASLSAGQSAIAILIFTIVAGSTVAIPVVAFLIAPGRMRRPLQNLRTWLVDNSVVITCLILLAIGVVLIGQGIDAF
jgi:hypothetical protein